MCVFRDGSFQLTLSASARRRGRPRHTWATEWATEVYRLYGVAASKHTVVARAKRLYDGIRAPCVFTRGLLTD